LTSTGEMLASGAWSNWLWLADVPSWGEALSLLPDDSAATALGRYFQRVTRSGITVAENHPWSERSFDLVVLHDQLQRLSPDERPAMPVFWASINRSLRPGGCLMVTCPNSLWYNGLTNREGAVGSDIGGARSVKQGIKKAGFCSIRSYYLSPSANDPKSIIPVGRLSVASYERMEMKLSSRGRLRSYLSKAGLHFLLYPSIMYLAYR